MLYYDRIDISEDIDVNKTNNSKECINCRYWYFLYKEFKFQPNVCNEFHDVLMMSIDFINLTISNIQVADYHSISTGISKYEVINLLENANLSKKKESLWDISFYYYIQRIGKKVLNLLENVNLSRKKEPL